MDHGRSAARPPPLAGKFKPMPSPDSGSVSPFTPLPPEPPTTPKNDGAARSSCAIAQTSARPVTAGAQVARKTAKKRFKQSKLRSTLHPSALGTFDGAVVSAPRPATVRVVSANDGSVSIAPQRLQAFEMRGVGHPLTCPCCCKGELFSTRLLNPHRFFFLLLMLVVVTLLYCIWMANYERQLMQTGTRLRAQGVLDSPVGAATPADYPGLDARVSTPRVGG